MESSMDWLKNLKTGAKLNYSFVLMCALLVLTSAFALRQLASLNASTVDLMTNWVPSLKAGAAIRGDLAHHRMLLLRSLVEEDPGEAATIATRLAADEALIDRSRRFYLPMLYNDWERTKFGRLFSTWDEYLRTEQRLTALVRGGRQAESLALFKTESKRQFDAMWSLVNELVDWNDVESGRATARSYSTYDRARLWLFALVALNLVLGVLLSRLVFRSIAREVAALAAVSTGLNAACGQLSAAAAEVASGAQEQASGLEETASSLEEITSTVKQNADSAQQASQLAASAREVAERGGQIVCDAVGAMGEINRSSNQIADIITTIDEIAFQTNLLALNAAVEAARAGEQGRGFAVVAAEVRTLALRSAAASKEIKGLIKDSVGKVEAGSTLVTQSGTTLREIITAVKRVTDVVAEIAAATREQATGIDQVNRAVAQMDGVTQSNASQSEEMAGTAESLTEQARELERVVEQMSLNTRPEGPPAAAARPPAGRRGFAAIPARS
jgi:methyl-accepting chemotaxis protein